MARSEVVELLETVESMHSIVAPILIDSRPISAMVIVAMVIAAPRLPVIVRPGSIPGTIMGARWRCVIMRAVIGRTGMERSRHHRCRCANHSPSHCEGKEQRVETAVRLSLRTAGGHSQDQSNTDTRHADSFP